MKYEEQYHLMGIVNVRANDFNVYCSCGWYDITAHPDLAACSASFHVHLANLHLEHH